MFVPARSVLATPYVNPAERAAIRSNPLPYSARSSGATFETVEVGNHGCDIVPGHVIASSRFAVCWRAEEATGATSGGGLRPCRREVGGTLEIVRQIGTHDDRW